MVTKPRPGRPAQEHAQDASDSIVKSACLHYARHGIKGSSKRQIAHDAKVTPALVHYYFKREEELHLAVLRDTFLPLVESLGEVKDLAGWVAAFHAHLMARPWLPHLMIREVLPQNGGLRALFLRHFAPHLFSFIKAMVTKESKARKVRRGFDIDRHVVLLMGMLVYPFIGLEIAQDLTGRRFDRKMMESFRDDALRLFQQGIGEPRGGGV